MKKVLRFTIILAFLCVCLTMTAFAKYVPVFMGGYAKVVEIIDGDAIKVQLYDTSSIALVKLAGIDACGYDEALRFLNRELMGKKVNLVFPSTQNRYLDRWNIMNVYLDDVLINKKLVELGYAKSLADGTDSQDLAQTEEGSRQSGLGMWTPDKKYNIIAITPGQNSIIGTYEGNGININTATPQQISNYLDGVSSSLAQRIVSYREYNPINNLLELKFVEGFTKDILERNKTRMTVMTNINKAGDRELLSLKYFNQTDVDYVIRYRDRTNFTSASDLVSAGIPSSKSEANKGFIDTYDKSTLSIRIPDSSVELNQATKEQLMSVGLSDYAAQQVIDRRGKYSYKTLDELYKLAGVSRYELDKIQDNLTISGGNSYDFTGTSPQYTNISTATFKQLTDMGMTDAQANSIYNNRRNNRSWTNLPTDLTAYDSRISIFTNINKATYYELTTLSVGMTSELAQEILNYRNTQPFGSLDEVAMFFDEKNSSGVFREIRDFIVLR